MKKETELIPVEMIERKIHVVRGVKVMIDSDLAYLYHVPTKRFNEAVKRNKNRFPEDFMFQLNKKEMVDLNQLQFATGSKNLRSQFATSSSSYGGRRFLPYVFTEQGVAMLASVLKSKKAVETSIVIVRAFIKLREMLQSHRDIIVEIEAMKRDRKADKEQINSIIQVINKFFEQPKLPKKEQIGFKARN
jgi:hypothetical protein